MRSWVASANAPGAAFPLNNLPCGVFSTQGQVPRCGVAIGDCILDLAAAEAQGLVALGERVFDAPFWNRLMALGPDAWDALRQRLIALLAEDSAEGSAERARLEPLLVPQDGARMHLPFQVAEFTDFYAGRHHAQNVGTMFRGPENALPPNWLHMPIGYNGRASTVVVSGTPVRRPLGQLKDPDADRPRWGPTERLDFELEMGAVVGVPSEMGRPVSVAQAERMIFGYVLLNDWSARDVQAWEYQPLGPFQAKAFATSISPWIVTSAALAPFRRPAPPRDHPLLPYLADAGPAHFDVTLQAALAPEAGPQIGPEAEPEIGPETTLAQTNWREVYYSSAQQLAHHTSSGCAMRTGDLLGSGTISGAERGSEGSLLELTWGGERPVMLKGGQERRFLEDGDRLTLRGWAQGEGYRIGFGDCTGRILPAPDWP